MNDKPYLLVMDDEEPIRKLLKARFEREGFQVFTAGSVAEATPVLSANPAISIIVTDVKMPGKDGLTFTKELKQKGNTPKVIVMTGHGEKSTAIEALRAGASDYLEKPFDMEEMVHSVNRTWKEYRLERENEDFVQRLEARITRVEGKELDRYWFVSSAKSMERVNDWLKVLKRESLNGSADEPSTLIIGESGTGKEGIARMIHAGSRRASGPWIAVNCANFSEQLLESELFGHEKGSFTGAIQQKRGLFELAKGGTLFLDEIGEMDVKLQARLLRVLQEKVFRRVGGQVDIQTDVRVVAATNQNLHTYIAQGKFRDDLYHRVAKVVIDLPGLRNRQEDLVAMASAFFERSFQTRGKHFEGFAPDATEAILNYSWPGNVRELLNTVERAALLWDKSGKIEAEDLNLPNYVSHSTGGAQNAPGLTVSKDAWADTENTSSYTVLKKKWSDVFEKEYLTGVLEKYQGNVTAAARESGVDRSNFLRLLRRHQIDAEVFRNSKKAAS